MRFKSASAALLCFMLLAGCGGARIGLRSEAAPALRGAPAAGTSYSSATISAQVEANAYFGLLFLGVYAIGAHDDSPGWRHGAAGREPPPLAADRSVVERDCSRPMVLPSANLRCK
jgi:hypothetical protein